MGPALLMKCDVNPSTYVSALQWNPCIPDTIAVAFYDGTLLVSQVTTGQINKVQTKARYHKLLKQKSYNIILLSLVIPVSEILL